MLNTINHPTRGRLVCKIWDNGGRSFDRYTVVFKAHRIEGLMCWTYLAASENPFHPQGFGQHGESLEPMGGKHLGKRVTFDALPVDVQKFIMQSI